MYAHRWLRLVPVVALALVAGSMPVGAQAQRGGTLVHALRRSCADTLNQHLSNNTPCRMVARHVLDNLVAVNTADGSIAPWLAESWEVTAGGRIYVFKLRRGVRFHDGTPFNAEAVKFNFDWTMSADRPKRGFRYLASGGPLFLKAEVVNEFTLRIIFREPFGSFLTYLSDGGMGIDSPTALRRAGDDYGSKGILVGTGPFKLVQWVKDDKIILERNPDYRWGAAVFGHTGPAFLDRIIYQDIPETTSRVASVETGETGIAQISESDVAGLRGKADVRVVLTPKAGTSRMLLLNLAKGATTDIRVRRAINHAINKPLLIKLPAWAGIGRPAFAPLPTNMVPNAYQGAFTALKQIDYEYNVDRAKQLLEEAGWRPGPGGIRMKGTEQLIIEHVINDGDVIWSQPLQAMLRQVGIDLRFRVGDFNFWLGTVGKGDFGSTIMSDSGYDAHAMVSEFFRSGSVYSWYGFHNSDLDKLLDSAGSASSAEDRWKNLIAGMRIVIQNAVGVMAWEQDYVFAVRTNVEGVQFNEVGFPYFATTWLKR